MCPKYCIFESPSFLAIGSCTVLIIILGIGVSLMSIDSVSVGIIKAPSDVSGLSSTSDIFCRTLFVGNCSSVSSSVSGILVARFSSTGCLREIIRSTSPILYGNSRPFAI